MDIETVMNDFAARGIQLKLYPDGKLTAGPGSKLNNLDRVNIARYRPDLVALLTKRSHQQEEASNPHPTPASSFRPGWYQPPTKASGPHPKDAAIRGNSNHPTGDPELSPTDTKTIANVAQTLAATLLSVTPAAAPPVAGESEQSSSKPNNELEPPREPPADAPEVPPPDEAAQPSDQNGASPTDEPPPSPEPEPGAEAANDTKPLYYPQERSWPERSERVVLSVTVERLHIPKTGKRFLRLKLTPSPSTNPDGVRFAIREIRESKLRRLVGATELEQDGIRVTRPTAGLRLEIEVWR